MEKDGLIENIRDVLKERRDANTLKQVDRADRNLLKIFKSVEATKDVDLMLGVFGAVLQDTQKYHINHPEIKKSINNALKQWQGACMTLPQAHFKDIYQWIANDHVIPQKQVKERPKDQVRFFLTSHIARIRNECKGLQRDARVGLLNAQLSCLRTAEKEYIKLQDKAMGREPATGKDKSKGIER